MKANNRGQGMVEAVLSIPLLLLVSVALILLLYRGLVFSYADYHLHEALICSEGLKPSICESELSARLKKVLLKNTKFTAKIFARLNYSEGTIRIDFNSGSQNSKYVSLLNSLVPELYLKQELKRR